MAVFRVEKTRDFTVMANHHLRNRTLSLRAKGLLSLMLSLPEDWDYTTRGLARICKDGADSIGTTLKELETHGYLTRERVRGANGQLGAVEYTIHEQPISPEKPIAKANPPKRGFPDQVNPDMAAPAQEEPVTDFPAQLNIQPPSTFEESNTHPINHAGEADWMDGMTGDYRELIRENIEYDILAQRYDHERLDEIVELMLEVVISKRKTIRIAGDDFPSEIVKNRMLKIDSTHVEYVFESIVRGCFPFTAP